MLVLLAVVRRRPRPLIWAAWLRWSRWRSCKGYDHFGPRTHFTAAELRVQEQIAQQHPQASNDATSANESSTSEHLA